jgi:hypothetical protein
VIPILQKVHFVIKHVYDMKPSAEPKSQRYGDFSSNTCLLNADNRVFPNFTQTHSDIPLVPTEGPWPLEFWQLTPYINAIYAHRHKYQYWMFHIPSELIEKGDRAPHWYRLALSWWLLRNHCDRVLWLDTDAFVNDHSYSLEDLEREFQLSASSGPFILMPSDCCSGDNGGNTGVYLIVKSEKSQAFLKEWWDLPLNNQTFSRKLRENLFDQDCLNYGLRHHYGSGWKLVPLMLMTTPQGSFIRHYWASDKDRKDRFMMELARVSIQSFSSAFLSDRG